MDAMIVSGELQRLEDERGRLTPEIVVDSARHEESPLHDEFDWDDGVAAHQWRIEQARRLIRSVKVSVVTETTTIRCVTYVRDPAAGVKEQGYIRTMRAVDEQLGDEVLAYEMGRLLALTSRVVDIAEALEERDAVEDITKARRYIEKAHGAITEEG